MFFGLFYWFMDLFTDVFLSTKPARFDKMFHLAADFWTAVAERSSDTALGDAPDGWIAQGVWPVRKRRGAPLPAAVQNLTRRQGRVPPRPHFIQLGTRWNVSLPMQMARLCDSVGTCSTTSHFIRFGAGNGEINLGRSGMRPYQTRRSAGKSSRQSNQEAVILAP